ncbi:MAG: M20 peptidase family dipeptidase, partial [Rhodospirillales bacterium]
LSKLTVGGMEGDPDIDPDWGEPGLTAEEKVFGWNTFEILAFKTGNPDNPVNAVPPKAFAKCHMRFVAGFDPAVVLPTVRKHLDALGYDNVTLTPDREFMAATRLEPDTPWAKWAINSLTRTAGEEPAVLPNLGGSLPNDCFAHILGLPTVGVPHSYPAGSQHAPNEHILEPVSRSALRLMGGLFWDLGETSSLPLQ